jgi:hypothetical protein
VSEERRPRTVIALDLLPYWQDPTAAHLAAVNISDETLVNVNLRFRLFEGQGDRGRERRVLVPLLFPGHGVAIDIDPTALEQAQVDGDANEDDRPLPIDSKILIRDTWRGWMEAGVVSDDRDALLLRSMDKLTGAINAIPLDALGRQLQSVQYRERQLIQTQQPGLLKRAWMRLFA